MDYGHFMGFGGGFMWILWPILIAAIVWAVIGVAKSDRRSDGSTPREILDQRFARGEIDAETYKRMKKELD